MEWTPQKLTELATGYWAPGALLAASEVGLFDVLTDHPQDADSIAHALRRPINTSDALTLLNAMTALRLVEKTGNRFAIRADAKPLLCRESPTCMLDALTYNAQLFRQWGNLADTFAGRYGNDPVIPSLPAFADDPAATRRFVYAMESKARALSPAIAARIDLHGARTLLDVGAGPGTLSRLLAERSAELRVTLLDLPLVLRTAAEINASFPSAARLAYHPADYHHDPLPGGFDAVLYAGALHQEPPDAAQPLAHKLCEALRPGGTLLVVDIMLNDDRTSPAFAVLFELNMLLSRPTACVHSTSQVVSLLTSAGLRDAEVIEVPDSIYRIVQARKPEIR
jgi:SAM-dependent methyltransferase